MESNNAQPQSRPAKVVDPKFQMKRFEQWKAEPVFGYRFNEETGEKEKYIKRVDKIGDKPLCVTNMEQRHADNLNEQVENSGFYYFETSQSK